MKRLWDISPPLHTRSPVFPGDTPYSQIWGAILGPGCPVNVSQITTSPHAGAHADAPLHYANGATPIGLVPLDPYPAAGGDPSSRPAGAAGPPDMVRGQLPTTVLGAPADRPVFDR